MFNPKFKKISIDVWILETNLLLHFYLFIFFAKSYPVLLAKKRIFNKMTVQLLQIKYRRML